MYYFVTRNKKTGEITGYFKASSKRFVPAQPTPDEENIEVTDEQHIKLLNEFNPMKSQLRGTVDAKLGLKLSAEPAYQGQIELSCDLPDRDGDGLPELPADGKSVARIKATLVGPKGKVLVDRDIPVRFQVNRGMLSRMQVNAEKGAAEVELRSIPETVRIRVTATAEGFERGLLDLQLVPPGEYEATKEE